MSIVVVKFETRYKADKARDWVLIGPRGEGLLKTQTWYPVDTLDPSKAQSSRMSAEMREVMGVRWQTIKPAYDAWKDGQDVPENGVPLAAWAGVAPEQAAILRQYGIRTVEEVAEMSESTVNKLPWPGRQNLPKTAKAYLDGKDKSDAEAKLAEANERMAAMEAVIAEMQAKREEPAKRGPGRPKKTEAA